jgi:hypothetical protein
MATHLPERMSYMYKWIEIILDKYINGGTALVLMGGQWLYLWVFPWYIAYINDPQWGHNYAEAIAFLAVGLAYFSRRSLSHVLAFLATLLIIPASLELLPHPMTAITGAVLLVLVILDMIIERRRKKDLLQLPGQPLNFWVKKHVPRFSYLMLGHMALIYFLVRLPLGTYETDLVTKVYDGMLIIFIILILLEDMSGIVDGILVKRMTFFWGMITMIVSLILLFDQPETWPTLALTLLVTLIGVTALLIKRTSAK